VATTAKEQRKGLATALGVVSIVVAGVIATNGDSWSVKMILGLLALVIAVRLFRWSQTSPQASNKP
jgi:F0F1-type ATP synthase assembly protein I